MDNINTDQAEKFFNKNKEQILGLFKLYQMIELLLFMKLFFPEASKKFGIGSKKAAEYLTKKINSNYKTFGSIKKKYNKIYPNDEWKMKDLLEIVNKQRNSFMHSFWIIYALLEKEIAKSNGEKIFKNYEDNADKLFKKVLNLPI